VLVPIHTLKHMNEGGRIIMISSAVGERASAPGLVPCVATKDIGNSLLQKVASNKIRGNLKMGSMQYGPF